MTHAEVLVRLIVPDPWSFTVYDTLQRKFHIGEILSVERFKCWQILFNAQEDATISMVKRILSTTTLLANPNRDMWCMRINRKGWIGGPLWNLNHSNDYYLIRVTDIEDITGEGILKILKSRLGLDAASKVTYSTMWLLGMSTREPDSRRIAERIAVARKRRVGLFANPHFQVAEVIKASSYFGGDGD